MLIDSSPAILDHGRAGAPQAHSERNNGSHAAGEAASTISFPLARTEHDVKQPYIKRLRIR